MKLNKSDIFAKIASAQIDSFIISEELIPNDREFKLKKQLIRYLCIQDYFDSPTQALIVDWVKSFSVSELILMCRKGGVFNCSANTAPYAVSGQCHALTALNWFLNETLGSTKDENLYIYTGVADKAFHHSWLYDAKRSVILEPTHIDRETYFGYWVQDPFQFFTHELVNIFRLIDTGEIDDTVGQYFNKHLRLMFNDITFTHEEYLKLASEAE